MNDGGIAVGEQVRGGSNPPEYLGGLSVDGAVIPEGYRLTDAELATGQAPPFPPQGGRFNPLVPLPPSAEEMRRDQLMEQIAVKEGLIDAPEAEYKAFLAEFGDKPNIAALEDQLRNASTKTKRAFYRDTRGRVGIGNKSTQSTLNQIFTPEQKLIEKERVVRETADALGAYLTEPILEPFRGTLYGEQTLFQLRVAYDQAIDDYETSYLQIYGENK
jgi:hypothetical protein